MFEIISIEDDIYRVLDTGEWKTARQIINYIETFKGIKKGSIGHLPMSKRLLRMVKYGCIDVNTETSSGPYQFRKKPEKQQGNLKSRGEAYV